MILSDVHIKIKDKDLEVDFSYVYIVRSYIHFCSIFGNACVVCVLIQVEVASKLYQYLYRYCSLVYVHVHVLSNYYRTEFQIIIYIKYPLQN